MTSRVGRVAVRLKLAAHEKAHADETRRTVERVVIQQALDELERVVHERVGQAALVYVHRIAFRWRLDRADLDRPDAALAIGRELAAMILDELEGTPRPRRLRPVETANVVMFANADHAIAAALADAVEQRTAWFHASHPALAWAEAVAASPARASAIAGWLAQMDMTAPVARWLDERRSKTSSPVDAFTPAAQAPEVRDEPPRWLEDAPHVVTAADAAPEPAAMLVPRATAPLAGDAIQMPRALVAPAGGRVRTDVAALFYLARLVQQLDLGEHLWAIGVREGDVLAHIAGAAAGCELDDPAWRWFGGAFDVAPVLAPIAEWAVDELEHNLAATLARELARFKIAAAPPQPLRPLVATDARTAGAIGRCADALCQLWCARLDIPVDVLAVRAAMRVRGSLELEPGILRVTLPMEAIDVAIRRAGLDLDPGHLPWLGRAVELVFDEDL